MESIIKDKVAIVGMGCTKFGELWDKGSEDLIVEAAYEAYEDAGIGPKDIQAAWVGTSGSGRTGASLAAPLKLAYIPITRVENACATGMEALRNACFAVACGAYDIVLALGFEKLKDRGGRGLGSGGDQFSHPLLGQPYIPPTNFGLAATRYAHTFGLSYDELKATMGKIAVKNHHNGALHPKAHLRFEITLEQAINAPIISWPLGLYDCCGVSDGAAAAIITRRELARSFREDPVYIKGMGLAGGPGMPAYMPDYDYIHWEHTVAAAKQAYEQAGITNPRKELDLAIVHDCFTITELLIYEDLGFCEKGHAKEDIDAGTFTLEGELPVNTDGGLKCFGHPVGASGLRMAYEVYKQLQGKAEPSSRQLKNVELGLTHQIGGAPFVSGVVILGN